MTGERTGGAAAVARRVSSSKRLYLARRIVQWSMGTFPGFFVAFMLVGMYDDPPRHAAALQPLAFRFDGIAGTVAVGVLLAATAAGAYLLWRVICHRIDRTEDRVGRDLVLSTATVTVVVVLVQPAPVITALTVLWASCMTVAVRRRTGALLLAYALVLGIVPVAVAVGYDGSFTGTLGLLAIALIMTAMWAVFCGSAYSLVVLWEILNEAYEARDAQARLAVTEERLRFSRDLHDLIGHSLSAIAVKSELAARLAERDPRHAAAEMSAVQHMARESLREVRSAVSGYRAVDLAAEIGGVGTVLAAAGVRCNVAGTPDSVPEDLRPLAAWIVREAVTNVLRHSTAKRCDITLYSEGRAVVVEVFNDGAPDGADPVPPGNGLTGLTERTAAVGGTVSASRTAGDGFLLRAALPVPSGTGRSGAPAPAAAEQPPAERDVTA